MQRNDAAPVSCFFFCFYFLVAFFWLTVFVHNPCSASARRTVYLIQCAVAHGLLRSFRVVKHKIFCQSYQQLRGCTPNSWPVSFTVLRPWIASSATLALNSPVKLLRFVSLITCSLLQQVTILIDCPEIGIHYSIARRIKAKRARDV